MNTDFDIAIVGSGFAGSLLAMIARRLGRSVVLLERDQHPRFAIGESSTPLANLFLEELARRYDLPALAPFTKWGTWQQNYPHIGCGLKRGFTFLHHTDGRPWAARTGRANQLLVAASPHAAVADTHWYRPDFDQFFAVEAQRLGVESLDRVQLHRVELLPAGAELFGERDGQHQRWRARFVIDATGPRGFLHRALGLAEAGFAGFPATQGLFTHFTGVRRWEELHPTSEPPPFPVDDAALHHVFEGGWIWVLRFNNGITSAGVVAGETLASELRLAEGAPAWKRLLERLPSVRAQFAEAVPTRAFIHAPKLPFRSATAAGESWALLPSAAGLVDPMLSTGFPLTLLGVERLARVLEQDWDSPRRASSLRDYSALTLGELDVTARLVQALHANMGDEEIFGALTLLYFAAAMSAETLRRLGRAKEAGSFLRQEHATFGPAFRDLVKQAAHRITDKEKAALLEAICRAIEPINLAGLGEAARRNWYPCHAEDLLAAAPKLGATRAEIEALLARSGFAVHAADCQA